MEFFFETGRNSIEFFFFFFLIGIKIQFIYKRTDFFFFFKNQRCSRELIHKSSRQSNYELLRRDLMVAAAIFTLKGKTTMVAHNETKLKSVLGVRERKIVSKLNCRVEEVD